MFYKLKMSGAEDATYSFIMLASLVVFIDVEITGFLCLLRL